MKEFFYIRNGVLKREREARLVGQCGKKRRKTTWRTSKQECWRISSCSSHTHADCKSFKIGHSDDTYSWACEDEVDPESWLWSGSAPKSSTIFIGKKERKNHELVYMAKLSKQQLRAEPPVNVTYPGDLDPRARLRLLLHERLLRRPAPPPLQLQKEDVVVRKFVENWASTHTHTVAGRQRQSRHLLRKALVSAPLFTTDTQKKTSITCRTIVTPLQSRKTPLYIFRVKKEKPQRIMETTLSLLLIRASSARKVFTAQKGWRGDDIGFIFSVKAV